MRKYDKNFERLQLEEHFETALENEEFEIWYQPKYSAHSRKLVGAEALVRWRRADGALIPPLKFIPLFERNGNIIRLDEYVFRAVCRQQKEWQKQGQKLLPVSVNISRVSLYYSSVVEKYESISGRLTLIRNTFSWKLQKVQRLIIMKYLIC